MNKLLTSLLSLLLLTACSNKHFISDESQRDEVHRDFVAKQSAMPEGDLFAVFDKVEGAREREAMEFLYAYMPLGDVTDYSGEYYLNNVRASFMAKKEMPWGENVPEREFNHFVLPLRVNNENLDNAREVFYKELSERVKDLSMYDAVLEVNHWCHEHVNYKGSDSRTSSPLATVKTSWGRCGEESTLLVAALRSVCIPARQVYTPRWAHCDDNHAWVEAWVDGQWHFLGACEPEPVLDLGWFNAPASRTLLLHTRVFGKYFGPEEVIERTANHTEINVVDNYAETAKLNIKVVDIEGNAVANAQVAFKIYNYAEYCTVATKQTEADGTTWMTAGLGTMMIYASKDGQFGYEVLKIGDKEEVVIVLDNKTENCNYDIIPPVEHARIPDVTPEMRAENNRRGAYEDSLRNDYVADCVAEQNDGDYDRVIMGKTWGNYQTIKDFIDYASNKGKEYEAYSILRVISDKDLRDVSIEVLKDCLDNMMETHEDFYYKYVVSPRVSNEMLTPHRAELKSFVEANMSDMTVAGIIQWINENIRINNELNVRQIPMSPLGVLKSGIADSHSLDIFFVALARTAGIPSRIDPVTGKVQYFENQWMDVNFGETHETVSSQPGTLALKYKGNDDPRYYTHFSIKKFNGNTFDLLAYDAKDPGMDVGILWSELMENGGIKLAPGLYALSSGPRMDDGSVLNHLAFFTIESGKNTKAELVMRTAKKNENLSVEGLHIVAYLDGGSEPTTHAMQDISILKEKFEKWGGEMKFVFKDEESFDNFKLKKFNDLPANVVYEVGANKVFETTNSLPLFMILNEDGETLFEKNGYTIGLGEQLLKFIR